LKFRMNKVNYYNLFEYARGSNVEEGFNLIHSLLIII